MKITLALALVATACATGTRIVFQVPSQTREDAIAESSIVWDGSVLNIPQHTEKLENTNSVAVNALQTANKALKLAKEAIDKIADFKATPGPKGERGMDGEDGEDGEDGKDGKDGKPGPKGDRGMHGEDGEDGEDGKDGKHGKPGKPGPKGERGDATGASDALKKANAAYDVAKSALSDIHETPLLFAAFDKSKCVGGTIDVKTRTCNCPAGFTGGGPYEEGTTYPPCIADPCVDADSGIEGNFLKCVHGTIAGTTGSCRCECGTTGFTGLQCDVCAPGRGREGDKCVACKHPEYNNQESHEAECSPQTCPKGQGVTSDEGWSSKGGNCELCGKNFESLSNDDGQCVPKACQSTDPNGGAYWDCGTGTVSGTYGKCECNCYRTGYSGKSCENALPCQKTDSTALAGYKSCASGQKLTGKTGNCKCEDERDPYEDYRCWSKYRRDKGACGSDSDAHEDRYECAYYVKNWPHLCQFCSSWSQCQDFYAAWEEFPADALK